MKNSILLTLTFLISLTAQASTHWVSPTGTAAWGNCVGGSPLSGTRACSLLTANAKATAGDLVYLRAGIYNLEGGIGIRPSNSGSHGNMITFQAFTGEMPTITNGSDPFWLSVSYVSIKGITFSGQFSRTWGRIRDGANHNEIANCTFTTNGGVALLVDGGSNQRWATHNWIHNNTFTVTGQAHGTEGSGCTDGGGDVMHVGSNYGTYPGNTVDDDNNNTIENNVFNHAPHAALENYGLRTVIRNNVFHNEPWSAGCTGGKNPAIYSSSNPNYTTYNGMYGHRNVEIDDDYIRTNVNALIEGNRFGFAAANQDNDGADGLTIAAPQNIIRYNFVFAAMNPGLLLKAHFGGARGSFGNGGTYNRIYNNTLFQNGYGYPWAHTCKLSTCPWPQSNVSLYEPGSGQGNVLKNNLMYLSASYKNYGSDVMDKGRPSNGWSEIDHVANNWCTGSQKGGDTGRDGVHGCAAKGDPKFSNPDLTNPSSATLPDLSLQAGSPAIDGGTYLTTATNSGNSSTSLAVADAMYFQDGTWGSDLSRPAAGLGGTMQADWIAIGDVSNTVQISSITYGPYNAPSGTITLASPKTWSNGAHIWLYKKSDGAIVLSGSKPDYGASEFVSGGRGAQKGLLP